MKRALTILVVLVLTACSAGRTATWKQKPTESAPSADASVVADATAKGDSLWEKRDDKDSLTQALQSWELALAASPENTELLVKLARGYYLLADGHLRHEEAAYLANFEKGVDFAERALTSASPAFKARVAKGDKVMDAVADVNVEGVPALYWYATNLGKWAKAKGFTTTLAQKDTIKTVMERCLELDPTFFYAGPPRYFGAYYAVAPSFAGGDLNKSEAFFKQSVELEPNVLATKVLWAENLAVKRQDKELFRALLEEVLAASDDIHPDLIPETRIEKVKAQELLAEIDAKF